ncbi:hypothetical protein [Shewanella spartinae]|uniref:hypothetical protein n=1 Tax=Shewanella spartinae TaxID=2864205 RepID=UPI001C65BB74|nr:hypothetical protein [Shewanella spartinae]QYJ95077.1 hypothetical protein K0I31_06755 [Shewanella spartinae]
MSKKKQDIPLFSEEDEKIRLHALIERHDKDVQKLVELIDLLIDDVSKPFINQADIDQHFKNSVRYPRPSIVFGRVKGQAWIKGLINQYIKDVCDSAGNVGGARGFNRGAEGLNRLHLDGEKRKKSNAGQTPKAILAEFKEEVLYSLTSNPKLTGLTAEGIIKELNSLLDERKRQRFAGYLNADKTNNLAIIRKVKKEHLKS